jgi:L-Ala-D/L-Glu epimerase
LVNLSVSALSVPTLDPFVIASGAMQSTRSAIVKVELLDAHLHQSAVGLGEAACLPPVTVEDQGDVVKAIQHVSSQLLGRHIADFDGLSGLLDAVLPGRPVARAGLEMALLDALARLRGVPLFQLLASERTVACSIETDMTIPILPAAKMAELAATWFRAGFRSLKVKVGKNLATDLAALLAIHQAAPQATLRIDANGGLTVSEALQVASAIANFGGTLECFEQPCATLDELAQVAAALEAPVIADESVKTEADLDNVIRLKAADGVNLKIMKSGGMLNCLKIALKAREAKLKLMVGGMVESRLGMTAASQLVAALGGVEFCDLDTAWLLTDDPFVGGYISERSLYRLPERPGLDVSPKQQGSLFAAT